MNKGFISVQALIGLVLGAVGLLFIFGIIYGWWGVILDTTDGTCSDSSLKLLKEYENIDNIENSYVSLYIPEGCALISFNDDESVVAFDGEKFQPNRECSGKNCLCLCTKGDRGNFDSKSCLVDSSCETFDMEVYNNKENIFFIGEDKFLDLSISKKDYFCISEEVCI